MIKSGISQDRQIQLFRQIDQYNSLAEAKDLIGKYRYIGAEKLEFDEFKLQEAWNRMYPEFTGYNCRITSMSLLADFMDFDYSNQKHGGNTTGEPNLAMDFNSLSRDSSAFTKSSDMKKFKILYATIKVPNTKDQKIMKESLVRYLKSVGFRYNENVKTSLVTVHFHTHFSDDENEDRKSVV